MPSGDSISHAFLLSTMWPAVMAQVTIPYIPTHAFSPSQGSNGSGLVYVLQPRSDQSTVQLLSLNLSTTINPSSPQYTVLYDDVPFSTNSEAYVPMPDSNGSITVFTGNCQASQSAAPRLWSFQPDQNSLMGNGTWSSVAANGSGTNVTGPGYLASGFAFNSSNDTSSEFYTFGGMCPFAGGDQSDWTLNANYSNTMTALTAANTSSSNYIVQQTESSNSPIAEAGYTVTPLQKTSSTTSGGRVVQQGNFLFIGGHTETAFLNMSTLALFSLPQASWSYISIGANVGTGRTDLAIRATTQIEPRSGHSAVMSSDGSKIIVFGGWVGDTSTPADPQLAILEVGDDYGGSGPWTWSIPAPTGSGPGSGSGIFGHATTMLAEDVMMISGGYIIPASSGATSKRDSSSAGFASSSQVYLYNLTSNSWMPSYTAPIPSNTNTSSHSSGALSSPGEKAGLGVGVSAAVIAIICIGYFYWSRKRWSHRRQRDQQLRKLALGAERSNIWAEPGVESSYRGPGDSALRNSILENVYFSGSSHQYSAVPAPDNNNSNKTEGEGSGLLDDVPSPSKARRSLSSRPQRVQSAGRYEDSRTGYGSGSIHPIDERDEFETPPEEASGGRPESGSSGSSSNNNRFSDPFTDQSPSPTRGHLVAFHEKSIRRQEGTDGVSIRSGQSRSASPDKSERTHSDLSESSRSGISELSIQMSNHGSQRRSTHLFQSPIPTLEPSNHDDSGSGRTSPEKSSLLAGRPDIDSSGMRWPFERSGTVDSFSTSASHHRRSPVEGDTLLGSGPEWSTPPESPSRLSYRENRSNHNSNSPTWMGSIRKTLSNARKVVLSGYGNSSFAEEHRVSPAMIEITSPVDFDDDDNLSPQISRRASSASVVAHHQRRKQGPRDWAVDRSSRHSGMSLSTSSPRRSRRTNEFDDNDEDDAFNDNLDVEDPDNQGGSSIGDDDDWDVELAAEGRLVQITYTVPKERLRVVNAGAGDRVIGDDVSEVVSRTSQEGK